MSVNELLVYELTTHLSFDPEKAYVLHKLKPTLRAHKTCYTR